ncbi:MAG: hypothetical protein EOO59_00790 [Hymenobacter sp.]|nr:MAG: hypothetical protein EOO59_00790 [Hymenobacter sp.]
MKNALSWLLKKQWVYLAWWLGVASSPLAQAHPMPTLRVLLDLQPTGVAAEVQLPLGELQMALGQQLDVTTQF